MNSFKISLLFVFCLMMSGELHAFPDSLINSNDGMVTWINEAEDCGITYREQDFDYSVDYFEGGESTLEITEFRLGNQIPRFRGSKGEHSFLSVDGNTKVTILPQEDDYSKVNVVVLKSGWLGKVTEIHNCKGATLKK